MPLNHAFKETLRCCLTTSNIIFSYIEHKLVRLLVFLKIFGDLSHGSPKDI